MDDFFTPRHKRLDRIARAANVLAWIILAFQILYALGRLEIFFQNVSAQPIDLTITRNIWAVAYGLAGILNDIFGAFVVWLVLRGVAAGLNMLIETDLNYRQRALEASHEP